jgi:uncharacterized membrane protein
MSQKLIVTIFGDVDTAKRAARDFKNFEQKDDGFRIESGVMVQKNAAGKLTVLDTHAMSLWGTVIGAVTGGLIGLLGGPVGAIAGFTIGASAGLAGHLLEDVLDGDLTTSIENELRPGSVALILEAEEASPFEVENVVLGYGGKVFRQPLPW